MKINFSLFLLILFFNVTQSQTSKDIEYEQTLTTYKIINALENGNTENVLHFFDEQILDLQPRLKKYSEEINTIKNHKETSIVLVFDENYTI